MQASTRTAPLIYRSLRYLHVLEQSREWSSLRDAILLSEAFGVRTRPRVVLKPWLSL